MLSQNSSEPATRSFRNRIMKAGGLTLASYGVEVSIRLISNLILTRLLFPEAFGLMAAATALIVSISLISDVGVRTLIIQSTAGDHPSMLSAAWTFQLMRGTTLWLALLVSTSPLFIPAVHDSLPPGSVFADPMFPYIISGLSFSLVLSGLESTAVPLNVRRLNFKPVVTIDVTSRLISLTVTIAMAYSLVSVWALVLGSLTGSAIKSLLSHAIVPGPRMTLSFSRPHFREIVSFGKWINASSIASFVASQSDVLILGLLIPAPLLGTYYLAKSLPDAIETLLERLNASLTLSVLGEVLRTDPTSLKRQYYRFKRPLEVVAFGAAGFIFTGSEWIIAFMYDPRYADAGSFLRVLCLGLVFYPSQLIRSAFTADGKPHIVAFASLAQASTLLIFLAVGYFFYGPVGAVAGICFSRLVPSILLVYLGYGNGWVSLKREFRFLPLFALGMMAGLLVSRGLSSVTLSSLRHLF